MSVRYAPVGWNRNKIVYDLVLLAAVVAYLLLFLKIAPGFQDVTRPTSGAILRAQAFGTCAFLLLTFILCIGPLARLDTRFLPLLYNRRHFGVMTCAVAFTHASHVVSIYFSFSPLDKYVAVLASNTSYDRFLGFPFETFGIFALFLLLVLAATSHDFWLRFLTPPIWKAIHISVYVAYAAIVCHVALGALQAKQSPLLAVVVGLSVVAVTGLHLVAGRIERQKDRSTAESAPESTSEAPLGRGRRCGRGARRARHRGGAGGRRAGRGVPLRRQAVCARQCLRPSERAARRGAHHGRLRDLPLARLPVPARGRLRAAALHREGRDLPAQAGRQADHAGSATQRARHPCRARARDGGIA